jgi:hypothetical protein
MSAESKESPVAEESEPEKSSAPEATSAEPVDEKVREPDWYDEPEPDKEAPLRSTEPKVTDITEASLEQESKESVVVNAEPGLKQDLEETKFTKKVNDLGDW